MERDKYDIQIQPNFNLQEAIYWAEKLDLVPHERELAIESSINALNYRTFANICFQASRLQWLRDELNRIYSENVWIRVSSWLRAREWEFYNGRDGSSQHVTGLATDIQIMGLPKELEQEAYYWAMSYFDSLTGWTKQYDWGIHNDGRGVL